MTVDTAIALAATVYALIVLGPVAIWGGWWIADWRAARASEASLPAPRRRGGSARVAVGRAAVQPRAYQSTRRRSR